MFSRVLIANRGEIALRILRACRELDIETVVVYSEDDRNAAYLRFADDTVCIGPAASDKSYLDISRIIAAAEIASVEAIHPGYGFLSENARFAEVCRSCGIEFIGPSTEVLGFVGDKSHARRAAQEAGLPIIPGSDGPPADDREAKAIAHKLGYPVMIKASAGGGGRGMRVAHNDASLLAGMKAAAAEADVAFQNPTLYLEKLIRPARHVEVQILADTFGHVVHLGERDCSLQRRHQKLIEESPSPGVNDELRRTLGDQAVALARHVGYANAGTVEFLVDGEGRHYFMELNARIQVEHPITEMVTGIDLVKEQLRLASGERLRYEQSDISLTGWAIECRINAEDPACDFKPCPGTVSFYCPPGGRGVRLDSHIHAGYRISPRYDSLLAKLVVHQETRPEAIVCMRRALEEFIVEGVPTTIPLFLEILGHVDFVTGSVDTQFIERFLSH
jgi:acetyl-CoA carboxylase biotin carboxylase subunit